MRFTISSIEIENFRQYKDTQTIDFPFDRKRNVAIIIGKNGAGKTNLLNALTWCFYGFETHTDYEENEKMPIINTSALSALKPNEKTAAEVTVFLDTDVGGWCIRRTISGGKKANGEVFIDPKTKLSVTHPLGGQDKVETGDDTEVLINNLLPNDLKQFFFMDGERLREFFNKDIAQNIGESIEKVSQLGLMYKAAEHFESLEKELRKNVKESTPKLDEINQEIQDLTNRMESLKDSINKNRDETKKNHQELKDVKDFLKNCGIEQVELLENERQSIEDAIKNLGARHHAKVQERNRYLVQIAPFIYLKQPIEQSLSLMQAKMAKGDLPPKIKETLVLELIEKGKCICGSKVEGETKKTLEEYSKTLGLSEIGEVAIVGKTKYKDIFADISLFTQKMDIFHQEIQSFEDELEKDRRRLEQITDELKKGEDKEKIINYEKRRDELNRFIGKLEQQVKMDSGELEEARKILEEKRTEYDKELGSSEKNKKLKVKLELVQQTLRTLANTEIAIKENLRKQIQDNTESNFMRLIRKKGAFTGVIINEKYEVTVKHVSGYNVIDHLSAGEYMILGLSFMSALMNISGFKAPVIIDTPLGRIDDEHRDKITTELPVFLEGTQLILFVTPTEYDEKVRTNLSTFIQKGNCYKIDENTNQNESKVVKNV